ncbi:YdcF family protein [Vagococcus sp. BWB3-3]|uniref:YdcF family protein n=1 Tax=Vagococcus allomyrinae TaxID=2794353 RepID=A0A940P842_9ENTE|nr:YdcF family protein [Vagococcus allomyrinae]MBP1039820.1 YdcF family protein [Vagococcus allomyrinae]
MMGFITIGVTYLGVIAGLIKKVISERSAPVSGKPKKSTAFKLLLLLSVAGLLVASLTVIPFSIMLIVALSPFIVFSAGVVFTINGGIMLRRESQSLGNSLSLLLGVGLLSVSLATFVAYQVDLTILTVLTGSANFIALMLLISFLIFLFTAYVTQHYAKIEKVDYIIVLGCGLINHQVTPLLKSRLDRSLALYQQQLALGHVSKILVTGGQGADEAISEGEAMRDYLVLQGVKPAHIMVEKLAINTYENMLFSKQLIENEQAAYEAVFVSNNFHVFRSHLFAKQVGLSAKGVGSHTASYFLPSAMLREFVAVSLMFVKEMVRSLKKVPRGTVIYK